MLVPIIVITLLLILFVAVVLRAGAAARKSGILVSQRAQASDVSEVSGLRLILQHNEPVAPLDQLLKPLLTVDPQFSSDDFLAQASRAFLQVGQYDGGAGAASLPVTAPMAERLLQEAETWTSRGFASVTKDVQVTAARIRAVRVDTQQQAIDVHLTGTWTHYVAPAGGGAAFEGSNLPTAFSELATFVRPAGARSSSAGYPVAVDHSAAGIRAAALSKCPQCGGDVRTGAAQCPYCGTQLDQSNVPWLMDNLVTASPLDATAQSASSRANPVAATLGMLLSAKAPGDRAPTTMALGKNLRAAVEQISARDPNFSQERFLGWATQTYLAQHPGQNVQKADLIGVILTDTTENIIVLFVSLAGAKRVVEAAVCARPLGTLTPPAPTTPPPDVCASCGAPVTVGDAVCRSCGTTIPDTIGGWKLERIAAGSLSLKLS